ncbi:MAG: hypothetical protein QM702_06110 [Rubrivivax sp.]
MGFKLLEMPDLSFMLPVFDWIERHEKTVDLLKWAVLLAIAWAVGVFKFIRQKMRQPVASIEELTSRCLVEELDEFQGRNDAVRASFLVEVGLMNPTSEPVFIRHFSLAVQRRRFWRAWKPELIALTLPSRPRHQMGSGQKLLKTWFSNFPDEYPDLTLDAKVEPKHLNSGFLLFVCFAGGTCAPRLDGDYVRIRALVHLTTGETRVAKGKVKVIRDKAVFEGCVPGILDQISHESAWGAVR